MVLALTILSLILNGYLFFLVKQLTKKTNTKKLDATLKDFLYLLDELNVKINELDTKAISNKQYLLEELKHINKFNKNQNSN